MDHMRSVLEALEALGEDADQVADSLRQKGIKGALENCEQCPVANYLTACGFTNVGVNEYDAYGNRDHHLYEIALPNSVSKFVRYFDSGAYPDLQEPRK